SRPARPERRAQRRSAAAPDSERSGRHRPRRRSWVPPGPRPGSKPRGRGRGRSGERSCPGLLGEARLVSGKKLGGKGRGCLRGRRGRRIKGKGQTVARRFAHPYAPRYDRSVGFREMLPDFVRYLLGEVRAAIEHGEKEAAELQARIQVSAYRVQRQGEL